MASLLEIFGWFETGDIPTQDQFRATFSSFRHKENKIPFNEVEGLATAFQNTVTDSGFTAFKDDVNGKIIQLAKKDGSNLLPVDVISWKDALGIASIAVVDSLDENGAVVEGNVYNKDQVLSMLDMLRAQVDGSYDVIENIRLSLVSNDLNLDELQEIVDFIKKNREDIELLQQISVGNTTDDRITLTGNYPGWGVNLQNQLNDLLYEKTTMIESVVANYGKHREGITGDAVINHNLDTYEFVCEAYDAVTLYKVPIRVRILSENSIEITFDDQPINAIKVTISKI
jgi:hypothetical protein